MTPWPLPEQMKGRGGPILRRIFHMSSPILLVYYILPDDLWIGLAKVHGAAIGWAGLLVVEVLRLVLGLEFLGLRDYERWQLSAYFWGGTAFLLGLLFFPPPFVAVGLIGMAWVDPLCGWTRRKGGYPYLPIVVYTIVAFTTLWLTAGRPLEHVLVLVVVATALAIAVEYPSLTWIDDDFTMQFAPMLGLTLTAVLL